MKRLTLLCVASGLLCFAPAAAFAAAGVISFADSTTILLTEDPALTPAAQISLVRHDGTDGAVTAEVSPVPLIALESPDYPPLRYRLTSTDPWTVLPWRGIIPVSFGDGVSGFSFEIQAIDDDAWEGRPPFTGRRCTLTLQNVSAPAMAGAAFKGVNLEGNDPPPVMTVVPLLAAEGNTQGPVTRYVLVELDRAIARRTIRYTPSLTAAGTAAIGADFAIPNIEVPVNQVTLPAYVRQFKVPVTFFPDAVTEPDETFTLGISLTAYSLGPGSDTLTITGQALVTILNDEYPPVAIGGASVVEGNTGTAALVFPVSLAAALPVDVSFQWNTISSTDAGRATAGEDFVAASGTVIIPAGQTTASIAVTVNGDTTAEADETVLLSLTNPSESPEQFFLDVEALDSHELKSAACTIDRLAIASFWRPFPGIYAIRFPTGLGQRYIIEEAAFLHGRWIPASSILTGSGFPVTQLMFNESDSGFFHVRSAPPLPPGTPAAGS